MWTVQDDFRPACTRRRVVVLVALAVLGWVAVAIPNPVASAELPALTAVRRGGARLETPRFLGEPNDSSITCFQDSLSLILNPGCFSPPTTGDCSSQSTHFFVQYLTPVPSFSAPYRITSFAFISNDSATVFPSAGILLMPVDPARFPTAAELSTLQAQNLRATDDLGIIEVDLSGHNLVVTSGTEVVVCLQFPSTGTLTAVGEGPGILVDEVAPDRQCDFFTADGGQNPSTSWYAPAPNDPLDWGFEVRFEEVVSVERTSWSDLKRTYGGRRPLPFRTP